MFYGEPRRRLEVEFTLALRSRTEVLAEEMHRLYDTRHTPSAQPGPHCRQCSLIDICLPTATDRVQVARGWTAAQMRSLRQAV
jgi:CRISPR-associated exonuclease Cas4